jgi:hypothetical protein
VFRASSTHLTMMDSNTITRCLITRTKAVSLRRSKTVGEVQRDDFII